MDNNHSLHHPSMKAENKIYVEHSGAHHNNLPSLYKDDFIMVAYIAHGFGYHKIDRKEISIGEGDIILINPNIEHSFICSDDTYRLEFYLCYFYAEVTDGIWENLSEYYPDYSDFFENKSISHIMFKDKSSREIRDIFIRMIDEQMEQPYGYQSVLSSYLKILLTKIFRNSTSAPVITAAYKNNTVDRTIRHIHRYIYQDFTLQEIAHRHHMSTSYICRLFKKHTGMTITQYTNNARLEKIEDLLKNTNRSFEEILEPFEFSSEHLKRLFKQKNGMNMGAYRKKFHYREK